MGFAQACPRCGSNRGRIVIGDRRGDTLLLRNKCSACHLDRFAGLASLQEYELRRVIASLRLQQEREPDEAKARRIGLQILEAEDRLEHIGVFS